jgi:hypothetical protein
MRASIPVRPNSDREIEKFNLYLICAHPDIVENPVTVHLLSNGVLLKELRFSDHGWKEVIVRPPELAGAEALTIQVNRVWNPKVLGVSEDPRDLGVGVAVFLPEDK